MEWTLFDISHENVETTLEIIEDAIIYGFEFKVENGNIYYREIC